MGLMKCKECGAEIAKSAKTCPQCGAQNKKKAGILGWIFCIVVILPIAWGIGENIGKPVASPTGSGVQVPNQPAQAKSWTYGQFEDDMTGKTVKYAKLQSPDRAFFDFPYQESGGSTLSLYLRKGGRQGEDIFLRVSKGQVVCGVSSCILNIRIGDGPVKKIGGARASSGDHETIFLARPSDLKPALMQGKPFKVEIEFYKSGNKAFSFDPKGLTWE